MVDFSAITKWPNVPACYGWLSLDRRGQWRLQGGPVTHRGLADFMNRQYAHDESGNWFVQNGPQRVFVDLAYTPWVFRRQKDGFASHTGKAAGDIHSVLLDDEGSILLHADIGIGLLEDRDLARFIDECRAHATGGFADDNALLDLMSDQGTPAIRWQDRPLRRIAAVDVPEHFNFRQRPRSDA